MLQLSPPAPEPSWLPPAGLFDPPPETLDLSPMGSSSRPGSGALRRRSSVGGPQGGEEGGGPSSSLEPEVEQGMPLGMQTSIERRKVNGISGVNSEPYCFGPGMLIAMIQKRDSY